ncbi:MAG: ABC-F type ribosomal protection protein [Bacillota bacterium]|nr:ABC-F type ribosomal protection protein [Bacillota bacterium]
MTVLLSCRGIKKEFGEVEILKDINMDIAAGDRAGLVGINGAGKSTLANIIFGDLTADAGTLLWYKKNVKVGYLHQDANYSQALWTGISMEDSEGGYASDFYKITSSLGIERAVSADRAGSGSLSGGEKMKLALADIWSREPDFLILDEPTNHLDYQGVQWLITELKKYKGTILLISHDRYFLDESTNRIVEISKGTAETYNGNYSFFKNEKQRRFEAQLHQYNIQESYKEKIQEEIDTLKNWSEKAHRESREKAREKGGFKEYYRKKAKKRDVQVKSKIKRLEKLEFEGVEKPEEDKKINFDFSDARLKGARVLEASDIRKSYGQRVLFKGSSFFIKRGERIGMVGPNGCGKTTLLKILLRQETLDGGELFISRSVEIGYLSQETEEIDGETTVLDFFDLESREEMGRIRTLLANMGFDERMTRQKLKSLSQGEVTRLRMTKLIAKGNELLILDEPLNHLDIYSRERLEQSLKDYNGTIIVVSHDRYMLENLCDGLLVFEGDKIRKIVGSPKEYLSGGHGGGVQTKFETARAIENERLIIENEISFVLGELSKYTPGSPEYGDMDLKFKELIERRNCLKDKREGTKQNYI